MKRQGRQAVKEIVNKIKLLVVEVEEKVWCVWEEEKADNKVCYVGGELLLLLCC